MPYTLDQAKNLVSILHDAPDSHLDARMRDKLIYGMEAVESVEEMRTLLHEVLDFCVNGALASTFVMKHLDFIWRDLGGQHSDPAPWRTAI